MSFKKVKKTVYDLKNENNRNAAGFKFVCLCDYHNNEYNVNPDEILDIIDIEAPDFVILSGDMVTAKPGADNSNAYRMINLIAQKYEVYYGPGNHEYRMRIYPENYGDAYDELMKNMDNKNIHYLDNKQVNIKKNGCNITITGLEIDREYYRRFKKVTMPENYVEQMVGKKSDAYNILIAHNPKYFDIYSNWGADIVLSGHVHGGIMRLPIAGGVISPDLKLFPKYDYGLFAKNNSRMILSSGVGAHTLRFRINNKPEVVVVSVK